MAAKLLAIYWGGRGGRGHPNISKKFEILSINSEKFDHLGCSATPKFWSSGYGHPKDFAFATPLDRNFISYLSWLFSP